MRKDPGSTQYLISNIDSVTLMMKAQVQQPQHKITSQASKYQRPVDLLKERSIRCYVTLSIRPVPSVPTIKFDKKVMASSFDEKSNISTAVNLKRYWDILGVLLVVLQLSSHFLSIDITSDAEEKLSLFWAFKKCISASRGGNEDSFLAFINIHIFVDIYFLADVILRLISLRPVIHLQALKTRAQITRAQQLRTCWFIIDLLLIFPHGFCWQLWQSRPALQLLNIRQGKRPIFEFFRNRDFRKKVFQLFREHRAEKKMFTGLKGLFLGGGSVLVTRTNGELALPVTRVKWVLSLATLGFRKSSNLIARLFRSWNKYRSLKVYSTVVRWISWMAMSLRAVYISRFAESCNSESEMDDISTAPTDAVD